MVLGNEFIYILCIFMSVYASSVSQLLLLIVPSASCFGRYYRPLINCDVTPDTRDRFSVPFNTSSMGHTQQVMDVKQRNTMIRYRTWNRAI